MRIRRFFRGFRLVLAALLAILLLAPEWSALANEESQLQSIVGLQEFDYLVWESNAILEKGEAALAAGHRYLDEETSSRIVLEYLALIRQAQQQEGRLNSIYGDPDILDPALETRDLQEELKETREELARKQPLAEAIVQEQVATILIEAGLEALGQAWPPVLMQVTPLPSLLVVSPREHIEQIHQISLVDGLSTPDKELLETAVFDDLNRSALVVPLGGIGTFPAMIIETGDINRLAEIVAHEWTHHWLTLKPLGISYFLNPDVRIINETVASLVDQELGQQVVERYYPEYLPSPVTASPVTEEEESGDNPSPPEFDFQAELADTRIKAEELLAEGHIEEAEEYMEQRRRQFREHGYHIRKLNQAFFAFYGAYAAEPGGAQGGNPIGPMLRDIREHSPSLEAFLRIVSPITSFADLQEIHEQLVPTLNAG